MTRPTSTTTEPGRLLLVSDDQPLVDEVHRLAAGVGVRPHVVAYEAAALPHWHDADVVLVGTEAAGGLAALSPPRRPGVHLLSGVDPREPDFRHAVRLGAESVLALAEASTWLAELLAGLVEARRPGVVLAVTPGSGGAGATTLACALGQVAARSGPALVVDTDPLGPGADRVLGLDGEPGLAWSALAETTGRLSGASLREAVPARQGLGVLTWGGERPAVLAADVVRESVEAARRAHDVVVVDLAPSRDRAAAELVTTVTTRAQRVLVVVRPTLVGVAAAARLVAAQELRPGLVVRGTGLPVPAVEEAVGAPVLLEMPDQRGLDESVELGLGPARSRRGPLARGATDLLEAVRAG